MLLLSLVYFVEIVKGLEGHVVVEKILGTVEASRFVHYSLSKPGRVVITLIPKEGDPDLYIGENGSFITARSLFALNLMLFMAEIETIPSIDT